MSTANIPASIFPASTGLSRHSGHWEDHLAELTPWEEHGGVWFKREDYFAPLGYGGPNGSKLRQLIWMVNRGREGKTHILTGASLQSPQLSMTAVVGAHYGLPCRQVVYSRPDTVLKHVNPHVAAGFGAQFEYAKVGYNPALQKMVGELRRPDSLVVEYGITLENDNYPGEDIRKFHALGGNQVCNLPPEVTRLIIPAGSCNSLVSILYGLTANPAEHLREIFTMGIGPTKAAWVRARWKKMGLDWEFPFKWDHVSLHDTGYSKYTDHFKAGYEGIKFHPTYEAKMWSWLDENPSYLPKDGHTGFWIVGSEPRLDVISPHFTHSV